MQKTIFLSQKEYVLGFLLPKLESPNFTLTNFCICLNSVSSKIQKPELRKFKSQQHIILYNHSFQRSSSHKQSA